MAAPEEQMRVSRPRKSESAKKRIKAVQNRALNKSRIAIGSEINRWNDMKKELTHCKKYLRLTCVFDNTSCLYTSIGALTHLSNEPIIYGSQRSGPSAEFKGAILSIRKKYRILTN